MARVIVPVAKPILLCEEVDIEGGLINLYGLFRRRRAAAFPHVRTEFVAFAQLGGGLGDVPAYYDIRRAADEALVHTTEPRVLRFADRDRLVRMAATITGLRFDRPGVYVVELFCDNTWVADTTFELLEAAS